MPFINLLPLAPSLIPYNTRNTACSQTPQQQTCAAPRAEQSAAAGFHVAGVGVAGPSALFGTGPSFTDVVSETEGGDGEEEEQGGGKKKKKKSKKKDMEKVGGIFEQT